LRSEGGRGLRTRAHFAAKSGVSANDDQAELLHVLADDPRHEGDRRKHNNVDERDRHRSAADLGAACDCGVLRSLAEFSMAGDVLDDDNRIVDQDSDRERESHERQHVDRKAEQPGDEERRQQRRRNRDHDDDRRTPDVQEEEQHDRGQDNPFTEVLKDAVDRLQREFVVRSGFLKIERRILDRQPLESGTDGARRSDRVTVRVARNVHEHGIAVVDGRD